MIGLPPTPPPTSKLKVWNTLASTTHIILELWGGGGGRCAFGGVSFLGPISALLIKWLDAFVEGLSGWVVATLLLRPVSCSCSAVLSHPQIYHTYLLNSNEKYHPFQIKAPLLAERKEEGVPARMCSTWVSMSVTVSVEKKKASIYWFETCFYKTCRP